MVLESAFSLKRPSLDRASVAGSGVAVMIHAVSLFSTESHEEAAKGVQTRCRCGMSVRRLQKNVGSPRLREERIGVPTGPETSWEAF